MKNEIKLIDCPFLPESYFNHIEEIEAAIIKAFAVPEKLLKPKDLTRGEFLVYNQPLNSEREKQS